MFDVTFYSQVHVGLYGYRYGSAEIPRPLSVNTDHHLNADASQSIHMKSD